MAISTRCGHRPSKHRIASRASVRSNESAADRPGDTRRRRGDNRSAPGAQVMIRVVVADDEKPARERLRRMLERDSRVEIVACCASGAETLRVIDDAEKPVHILLLDVQMPEMNGFEVVAKLMSVPL